MRLTWERCAGAATGQLERDTAIVRLRRLPGCCANCKYVAASFRRNIVTCVYSKNGLCILLIVTLTMLRK